MCSGFSKDHDSNLLEANGGPIALTKSGAKYLLSRMGFIKRHASTKGKTLATDFHELKAQFLFGIKTVIEMNEIPENLVINWDQTSIHYVLVSSYTMEKEGAKGVKRWANKCCFCSYTMADHFLPMQSVY